MAEKSVPLTGKPFQLPEGCQLIIVRAPADTDPSVFEGMNVSDLVEDEKQITKQFAVAYYESEENGFRVKAPSKSYTFMERIKEEDKPAPKVTRLEKPPMIPPANLSVSKLPFEGPKTRKKSSKKSKNKSRSESVDESEAAAKRTSNKKVKHSSHE
jgi:hypothetical protein